MKIQKSITVTRNAKIVGNNSNSYNDKHPVNPVVLRPIHDAIKNTPKILNDKFNLVTDHKQIRLLRGLSNLPKQQLCSAISIC